LSVLAPEKGQVGLQTGEKLGDHGGDAFEMARTVRALVTGVTGNMSGIEGAKTTSTSARSAKTPSRSKSRG
jgi:hypothetical protein